MKLTEQDIGIFQLAACNRVVLPCLRVSLKFAQQNFHHGTETENYEKLKQQILSNQEKAELETQLVKILSNHCGEDGDNEGAVETLERIIKKAEKWDFYLEKGSASEAFLEQENKKLKELLATVEKDHYCSIMVYTNENIVGYAHHVIRIFQIHYKKKTNAYKNNGVI